MTTKQKIEEILNKVRYLDHEKSNGGLVWIEEDDEGFQQALDQLYALIKAERKEMVEKIHQAFIKFYKGSGEVFFPYESEGNCTKEEELEAVELEWQKLLQELNDKG